MSRAEELAIDKDETGRVLVFNSERMWDRYTVIGRLRGPTRALKDENGKPVLDENSKQVHVAPWAVQGVVGYSTTESEVVVQLDDECCAETIMAGMVAYLERMDVQRARSEQRIAKF